MTSERAKEVAVLGGKVPPVVLVAGTLLTIECAQAAVPPQFGVELWTTHDPPSAGTYQEMASSISW